MGISLADGSFSGVFVFEPPINFANLNQKPVKELKDFKYMR